MSLQRPSNNMLIFTGPNTNSLISTKYKSVNLKKKDKKTLKD